MPMNELPLTVGLFTCEQVIVKENTHNHTPVNCFARGAFRSFPSNLSFVVFAVLTKGNGHIDLEVVVSRLDTLAEIQRYPFSVSFPSPLHSVRCTLRIRECNIPEPGKYEVALMAANSMLGRTILLMQELEAP